MTLESVGFRLPPCGFTMGDWRTLVAGLEGRDDAILFLLLRAESPCGIADSPSMSTSLLIGEADTELFEVRVWL